MNRTRNTTRGFLSMWMTTSNNMSNTGHRKLHLLSIVSLLTVHCLAMTCAFTVPTPTSLVTSGRVTKTTGRSAFTLSLSSSSSSSSSEENTTAEAKEGRYVPPSADKPKRSVNQAPYPKIGDVVRYYDMDGGNPQGQILVGKISLIQKVIDTNNDTTNDTTNNNYKWICEITELDNVGEGYNYYADYPSRRRRSSKQTLRNLLDVSPLYASYVRSEDAYKIPTDSITGLPSPRFQQYDLDGYDGPAPPSVDATVTMEDARRYNDLKFRLFRDAALAGGVGTIAAVVTRGPEEALVYAAGALAGVGYLFLLSVKTDTVGVEAGTTSMTLSGEGFGTRVSNARFGLPLLVLLGVALNNAAAGDASPVLAANGGGGMGWFSTVTKEQFCAAMLGFLTYRLPLFWTQLGPVVGESAGLVLPGSAGVVMEMAKEARKKEKQGGVLVDQELTTVLLVSGPRGTGKTSLVQRLVQDGNGKFVLPQMVDKVKDPTTFERLEGRDEFLSLDSTGRYGLTKEGIFNAIPKDDTDINSKNGENENSPETTSVVVMDADVNLAKKLTTIAGMRIVGVWVGLDTLDKFEQRLTEQMEKGTMPVPADETPDSVLRAKLREIVKDIEYGVVSGIFEFTILNDDFEESLVQLKEAASYCFK